MVSRPRSAVRGRLTTETSQRDAGVKVGAFVDMRVLFALWITGPVTGEMFTKITHISSMCGSSVKGHARCQAG